MWSNAGAAPTSITLLLESLAPSWSSTVSVTVYVPGSSKVCVGLEPPSCEEPSPKFQCRESESPSESLESSTNCTGSGARPVIGDAENPALGGVLGSGGPSPPSPPSPPAPPSPPGVVTVVGCVAGGCCFGGFGSLSGL